FSRSGLPVIRTDLPFEEIWLHDFEFISRPGERPDVVCLVAHELRSAQTLRLWRNQLGPQPPYRTDSDALFVSFVANAECTCHLSLGWPLPARVLDLSPAFRNIVNGRTTPEGKGLIGALRYYGLDAIGSKQKDAMRERIQKGWPFTPEEQQKILDYCQSDTDSRTSKPWLPDTGHSPSCDLLIPVGGVVSARQRSDNTAATGTTAGVRNQGRKACKRPSPTAAFRAAT